MAVTAAPTRRVNPVAWKSSREKLWAGFGRHRNRFLGDSSCLFNGNNKLIAPDHIQAGACRRLDSPRICSQSFNFRFQRLVNIAQCFNIGLHCRKLLRRHLNFGARAHIHRHTNGESREQNHPKNYPGGNYPAAPADLRTRSDDLHRDLLHRGQRTSAGRNTLRPDSLVNPVIVCYLAHLNTSQLLCRSESGQILLSLHVNCGKGEGPASAACHPHDPSRLSCAQS